MYVYVRNHDKEPYQRYSPKEKHESILPFAGDFYSPVIYNDKKYDYQAGNNSFIYRNRYSKAFEHPFKIIAKS